MSQTLEAGEYKPPLEGGLQIMITPLARTMLRPFGAIVLPGADAATLGPVPPGPVLIGDTFARELGLPTVEGKRHALAWQFARAAARAGGHAAASWASRQRAAGGEPLLDRLDLALQAAGHVLPHWHDPRLDATVPAAQVDRAAAQAEGRLPAALSASAVESLRQCP